MRFPANCEFSPEFRVCSDPTEIENMMNFTPSEDFSLQTAQR